MTTKRNFFALSCAAALLLLTTATNSRADVSCDDFLSKTSTKPEILEFRGCSKNEKLQGSPLEANYRVRGPNAAAAETYLIREFKIKKLRHNCCIWESTANFYRDKQGTGYLIDMSTEETTIKKRGAWSKIPYFYVRVRAYKEDP
jgi:hypothetical protein